MAIQRYDAFDLIKNLKNAAKLQGEFRLKKGDHCLGMGARAEVGDEPVTCRLNLRYEDLLLGTVEFDPPLRLTHVVTNVASFIKGTAFKRLELTKNSLKCTREHVRCFPRSDECETVEYPRGALSEDIEANAKRIITDALRPETLAGLWTGALPPITLLVGGRYLWNKDEPAPSLPHILTGILDQATLKFSSTLSMAEPWLLDLGARGGSLQVPAGNLEISCGDVTGVGAQPGENVGLSFTLENNSHLALDLATAIGRFDLGAKNVFVHINKHGLCVDIEQLNLTSTVGAGPLLWAPPNDDESFLTPAHVEFDAHLGSLSRLSYTSAVKDGDFKASQGQCSGVHLRWLDGMSWKNSTYTVTAPLYELAFDASVDEVGKLHAGCNFNGARFTLSSAEDQAEIVVASWRLQKSQGNTFAEVPRLCVEDAGGMRGEGEEKLQWKLSSPSTMYASISWPDGNTLGTVDARFLEGCAGVLGTFGILESESLRGTFHLGKSAGSLANIEFSKHTATHLVVKDLPFDLRATRALEKSPKLYSNISAGEATVALTGDVSGTITAKSGANESSWSLSAPNMALNGSLDEFTAGEQNCLHIGKVTLASALLQVDANQQRVKVTSIRANIEAESAAYARDGLRWEIPQVTIGAESVKLCQGYLDADLPSRFEKRVDVHALTASCPNTTWVVSTDATRHQLQVSNLDVAGGATAKWTEAGGFCHWKYKTASAELLMQYDRVQPDVGGHRYTPIVAVDAYIKADALDGRVDFGLHPNTAWPRIQQGEMNYAAHAIGVRDGLEISTSAGQAHIPRFRAETSGHFHYGLDNWQLAHRKSELDVFAASLNIPRGTYAGDAISVERPMTWQLGDARQIIKLSGGEFLRKTGGGLYPNGVLFSVSGNAQTDTSCVRYGIHDLTLTDTRLAFINRSDGQINWDQNRGLSLSLPVQIVFVSGIKLGQQVSFRRRPGLGWSFRRSNAAQ